MNDAYDQSAQPNQPNGNNLLTKIMGGLTIALLSTATVGTWQMNTKLATIEQKIVGIEKRFDRYEQYINARIDKLRKRVEILEKKRGSTN